MEPMGGRLEARMVVMMLRQTWLDYPNHSLVGRLVGRLVDRMEVRLVVM